MNILRCGIQVQSPVLYTTSHWLLSSTKELGCTVKLRIILCCCVVWLIQQFFEARPVSLTMSCCILEVCAASAVLQWLAFTSASVVIRCALNWEKDWRTVELLSTNSSYKWGAALISCRVVEQKHGFISRCMANIYCSFTEFMARLNLADQIGRVQLVTMSWSKW